MLYVFLSEAAEKESTELSPEFVEGLSDEIVLNLESDTYWCLEKLSENIQANYTEG